MKGRPCDLGHPVALLHLVSTFLSLHLRVEHKGELDLLQISPATREALHRVGLDV
jgi:hypothetical protein